MVAVEKLLEDRIVNSLCSHDKDPSECRYCGPQQSVMAFDDEPVGGTDQE